MYCILAMQVVFQILLKCVLIRFYVVHNVLVMAAMSCLVSEHKIDRSILVPISCQGQLLYFSLTDSLKTERRLKNESLIFAKCI
ncbi:hypothetical protein XELAEV_18037470mg [Xenopus laevis]|uniref:Uncharacterized protein n=1 Tax=Xenopus laevis TaxID=8355 RepID=A0A974HAM9_XENLA|nr:hypothetical protein XELAEV_18037470mg [Xenopus laevis]